MVEALYDPLGSGGEVARGVGRELLSQWISGYNTTLVIRTWEGSIPGLPRLGKALGRLGVEVPAPALRGPNKPTNPDGDDDDGNDDDGDDEAPHFITSATLHLLTSTATFTLRSPLRHSTLTLSNIDAHALYHDHPVGHVDYAPTFSVPPTPEGEDGTQSPRLPVEWESGGLGFGAVKRAMGGR